MYLETILYDINDFFVNKKIIINENEPLDIKIKKYLIKYKRVIGIVLLIILIIIGYYCFYDYNNDYDNSLDNYQKGGGYEQDFKQKMLAERAAMKSIAEDDAETAKKEANETAKKDLAAKKDKTQIKAKMQEAREGKKLIKETKKVEKQQKRDERRAKGSAKLADIRANKWEHTKKLASGTAKGVYNVGAYAADKFKDNAAWFYGILYSVAAFIALSLIIIPSLAFIVIGVVCYFLLKNKIKYFKSL